MEDKSKKSDFSQKHKQFTNVMRFSGLGTQLVVVLVLAAWGGLKLDKAYQNKFPAFTLLFMLGGLGGSMFLFIREVIKMNKKND